MTTAQISHHCAYDSGEDLSFIMEPTGQILPATPDGNEFSPGHVRDYLAGPPELFCRTQD